MCCSAVNVMVPQPLSLLHCFSHWVSLPSYPLQIHPLGPLLIKAVDSDLNLNVLFDCNFSSYSRSPLTLVSIYSPVFEPQT